MTDTRFALRTFARNPVFTIVAVLTLALGIGANTAIFSVVNGVLLKRLPYPEPERLVSIAHVWKKSREVMSGPNFTDVRRMSLTLADAAAVARQRVILTGQGEPVRLDAAAVSGSLFNVLGAQPLLGRTLTANDDTPGNTSVAVLGYSLWRERFGGDASVVGRRIMLDGVSTQVVGVMPQGFSYPAERALWIPIEYSEPFTTTQRGAWYLTVVGRVKADTTIERARAEIETIGSRLAAQYPDSNEGVGIDAVPLLEATVGDIRKSVLVLLGAVGFVLLIACANVANLLLARAAARETEMAVRSALGAGRGRLVRQLLTESIILGLVGGGLGLLVAVWGVDVLVSLRPEGIPRLDNVRVDTSVMLFTAALAILTGMLFGLVPAFHSTARGLAGSLKEGGRGALTTRGGARMRSALVVVEMALAVVLLAGAGLLVRSFIKLASVDPGFHAAQALTFELSLPDARYSEPEQQATFFEQLMPRLRALAGVQSAAAVISLPLSGSGIVLSFEIAGRPPLPPSQEPVMNVRVATADYFRTLGIPVKRGRIFTDDDRASSPQVVVITESAARKFFPNEDPIGKKIRLGWGHGPGTPRAGGEVVGIVGDVKDAGLDEPDPPQLYLPFKQWPVQGMSVILRTSVPPGSLSDAAAHAVYSVDPAMPVSNVRTMEEVVARSISQPRFYTLLLGVFAAIALTLAAIGIFGVLSYTVAQRTREIGIRMALGAEENAVLGLIVREAMLLAGSGVICGMAIAYFLLQWLVTSLLFGTTAHDPATFTGVAALLTVVAFAASYIPARRATRVDPMVALRV